MESAPARKALPAPLSGSIVCFFAHEAPVIGRIDFDGRWRDEGVIVVAASALRGVQETLLLAVPGSELRTEMGMWEVTWNGIQRK